MNNFTNHSFQEQMNFQQLQFSPQPQGIAYVINNSNELNNIPINGTTAVAFCFTEKMCYIRTLQNGAPVVTSYKLVSTLEEEKTDNDILGILKELDQRIKMLEKNSKRSGSLDELL